MNAKRGLVTVDDVPATKPEDWDGRFVTRSVDEPRAVVAVRFSPEVLAYFRATGPGWQTRMDQALREYIAQRS